MPLVTMFGSDAKPRRNASVTTVAIGTRMAYDPGAIEATLAAAVGDDPGLIAELRLAFVDSADKALATMENAADSDTWRAAAWRLKGLAASFGAVRLMALATEAVTAGVPDPVLAAKLRRMVARL